MDSYPKYTNIYINPSFNDTMKSVIHINPKIHGNMAIHVNPKIVNTLQSTELQQRLLQRKNNEQVTGTYDTNKNNIQKSVYVNPKLMLKLQNKVTKQIDHVQKQTSIQPQINPVINKPLEIQKNTNNLCQNSLSLKYSSPNFVALSKNKLVRVTSDAKKNINYQGKTILHTVKKINTTKKLINVNTDKKLVNVNTAKKLVNVNTSKKLVNTTKKLVNINSKNLSKPKELNSKNTKYKIDRTVIQKSKNKTNLSARKLLTTNSNLINIDGVLYKSSKSHLVRSTNSSTSGKRSSIGSTKLNTSLNSLKNKKLRRQSSIGKSTKLNVSLKNTTAKIVTGQKLNYKHVISNRVKQRSLQILRHKMCKNNQPCLLYQRFGYCAKYIDGICPKVHDKKQVALCKKVNVCLIIVHYHMKLDQKKCQHVNIFLMVVVHVMLVNIFMLKYQIIHQYVYNFFVVIVQRVTSAKNDIPTFVLILIKLENVQKVRIVHIHINLLY
ncbi:zinc finger CCCH domain-containing protein 3 isoform X2 [Aphidius gifuensis]|uniref:zinc finger CCCH domain-containing protein 3 isoform X2 n=1 Tax=Aphidius gifuensis TaxID=684658 RepID=UPI001CDB4BFF|nr:zinc finger CCCH domain-containing protein 3 isoform X2 [Aphidius gifuensis]